MSAPDTEDDLRLADFHFDLPTRAIAQAPAERREDARLLVLSRTTDARADRRVAALAELVRGDELFVFNDTRVVPARLQGQKPTGGAVELLVLEGLAADAEGRAGVRAMGRASKALREGTRVHVADHVLALTERLGAGVYELRLPPGLSVEALLEAHGALPLPPYIERAGGPTEADARRYQTVYARHAGAVAAPTAGLHFTEPLLDALVARGAELAFVTLHVGPGTFLPVRTERVADHRMHSERYTIDAEVAGQIRAARAAGRPVVAVGTTVVRTLEGAAAAHGGQVAAGSGTTDIFIRPGFEFRVVDQLFTNFHLPGSTLLMLVSAFCGRERVLAAYRHALDSGYRFYSYGDAMLIR